MKTERYPKIIYYVILMFSLIWCAGIVISPLGAEGEGLIKEISDFFYGFYAKSCHQIDERSFFISAHPFGVCSRCTSIYFAFLGGVLLYPFFKKLNNIELPSVWYLFLGAGVVFADAGLDIIDLHKNTFITREISGGILGVILPFYIIPGTVLIFYEFFNKPDKTKRGNNESAK